MQWTAGHLWSLLLRYLDVANRGVASSWTGSWPSFSLAAATILTIGGILLVFVGWATLPRKTERRSQWFRSPGMTAFGRVLLGVAMGSVAMAFGTYALDRITLATIFDLRSRLPPIVPPGGTTYSGAAGTSLAPLLGSLNGVVHEFAHLWVAYHVNPFALLVVIVLGAFVGWMSSSSRWALSGIATWLGLLMVAVGLFGYSILIVVEAPDALARVLGLVLLVVESSGFVLFLTYQFYTIEYIAGSRLDPPPAPAPGVDRPWPFVAVQVASFNEPSDVVERCLRSILALDYPKDRLLVQLLDDSTETAGVEALQTFCAANGIEFRHRTHRRGFKGGALNDGLRALPKDVKLIAIVDSDYVVDPQFLQVAVGPFWSGAVGFVQTPQAYRNAQPGSFARWYALADAYFYRVVQPVRARARSLIFCGTMGVVSRGAIEGAGGWSETCVTEDAELSIRLIARGWQGVYIDRTLGWGLAPTTMAATRSQHRRWANGGWQMLGMNRDKLHPTHMSQRQRLDFALSRVFWVDGLFLIAVTFALAGVVVASWTGVYLSIRTLSALALVSAAPLLLLLDGLLKIRVALRSTTKVSYSDVVGVLGFWYAIKLNDLWAALGAAFGSRPGFVRTPKARTLRPSRAAALAGSLRGSAFETTVALGLFGIIGFSLYRWRSVPGVNLTLPGAILLVWLGYYALAFAAAPIFDYTSRSTPEPPEAAPGAPRVAPRASRSSVSAPSASQTGPPTTTARTAPPAPRDGPAQRPEGFSSTPRG
ncbi:MAG: glycosyltransferase [Thermoplasmata archaeon]|nr:glycosyltransferase [Thermoplasmata archaeon]